MQVANEQIFQKLKDAICDLDDAAVAELVQEALDVGIPTLCILAEAIVPTCWTHPEHIDAAVAGVRGYSRYEETRASDYQL